VAFVSIEGAPTELSARFSENLAQRCRVEYAEPLKTVALVEGQG